MNPPILILRAAGTNRDGEAAWACQMAGGEPHVVHVGQLMEGAHRLSDYRMLVLPGGFSFGDDLGAGKLWAMLLRHRLGDELRDFIGRGRPVLGICNGFQVLVKSGLLPGLDPGAEQSVSLTRNSSGRFECRWVHLQADPASPCVFTRGLDELVYCPVAHGEGRLVVRDAAHLERLQAEGLAALRYVEPDGSDAGYPANPNGSLADIAGLCNPAGNVLGLMPHPEDHIIREQHPRAARGEGGQLGLTLIKNGVRYASEL
jgi:phosphoribosylformylglycinamidine synthase subunit PurQ / glutaminase